PLLLLSARTPPLPHPPPFPTRRSSDLTCPPRRPLPPASAEVRSEHFRGGALGEGGVWAGLGEGAGLRATGWGRERSGDTAWGYGDRKSTRLNSSHVSSSYAVFCLKKKK